MIDKQPEALRLAEQLNKEIVRTVELDMMHHQAAAELRRLYESEREGWRYADELEQDRKRLHEVNAELVEALSAVIRGVPDTWEGVQKAKAALRKATGENNDT